jgi:hypothetical protein
MRHSDEWEESNYKNKKRKEAQEKIKEQDDKRLLEIYKANKEAIETKDS